MGRAKFILTYIVIFILKSYKLCR